MGLKADGEDWEKNWQPLVGRDVWQLLVHRCILESACLGQQCSLMANFLSSSEIKISKYSIIKSFQVNT